MKITVFHERSRVPISVLSIVGDIDSSNYEQLDRTATQEIKDGAQYLLIDLGGVQLMSSAALRSLTRIFNKLRSLSMDGSDEEMHKGINAGTYKSPYLKLCKPSKAVLETLKIAGFDMLVEIHDDLNAALASF